MAAQTSAHGTAPGAGNLVSGNTGSGIVILGANNVVAGNRIGTTADGSTALGNGATGVLLTAFCDDGVCRPSSHNTMGGTAAGTGNLIAANGGNGLVIDGTGGGVGNAVQGNVIGTGPRGAPALGNHGN